jgi:hypothetical protein
MKHVPIAIAALAATVLFGAASAQAVTLEATWTYSPDGTPVTVATWEQDSAPTPLNSVLGVATQIGITDLVEFLPIGTPASITYYNNSAYPVIFSTVPLGGIYVTGAQAYTGSEATPQFAPGSFSGTVFYGDLSAASTLTFTAVPEPSTWVMLMAGFVGLGAAYVSRRQAKA